MVLESENRDHAEVIIYEAFLAKFTSIVLVAKVNHSMQYNKSECRPSGVMGRKAVNFALVAPSTIPVRG